MTDNHKVDLSIIIPVYNEEENISKLIVTLNNYLDLISSISAEIIFVDDGSTDNSFSLLQHAQIKSSPVKIIKLSKNFGSHIALRAGIYSAKGRYTTFLSADLQDPPEVVKKMYDKSLNGYDIVLACRNQSQTAFGKKLISRLYAGLMKRFIFTQFPSSNFDIVMFNEKVKQELNRNIQAHSSLFLQIFDLGFKQARIQYKKKERKYGSSKWTLSKKIKLLIDSFVAFSYVPIRFISITGILLSFIGFLWAGYVVFRSIIFHDVQSGWPTLTSVLMIGFGITNISLGIIAEYIWRIYDTSRQKSTYVIDKIVTVKK